MAEANRTAVPAGSNVRMEDLPVVGHLDTDLSQIDGEMNARLPNLVKGITYKRVGGVEPLQEYRDDQRIEQLSLQAEVAVRTVTKRHVQSWRKGEVFKGLNPNFSSNYGAFLSPVLNMGRQQQAWFNDVTEAINEFSGKNISTTAPLGTGFVPFDLMAPSKLIYPVYSPLRNKIPRVQGQGTSRRGKVLTGIQGTQTPSGSNAPARLSISELPGGGSLASWPSQLPPSGTQTAVDINIPYKFFGISEAVTWLAQFAGQGFEDISALANLILLQEAMLGEEYEMLWATGTALTVPSAPSLVLRTAGSNETAVAAPGGGNSYYIRETARTIYGETTMSAAAEAAIGATATYVIDVTLSTVRGGTTYNIYASAAATSSSAPTGRTSYFLQAQIPTAGVGSNKFTLQGTLTSTGTNPPAADTGTSSANDYEGMLSVLSGHAVTDASVYPSGFLAGYVNQAAGVQMGVSILNTALKAMWDGPGAFRADPAELIMAAQEAVNFQADVLRTGAATANSYRFNIEQDQIGNIRAGAAISEFANPITRNMIRILVHPWLTQGTAMLQSYTTPQPWSNITNIWENTMVQDYLSVAWPVIDASFRYSLFYYGTLFCAAPQYCGLIQGLQVSSATPYS